MEGESSGHDWWHVSRVWQTAKHICAVEKADRFEVELTALLHDIADWKFNDGDELAGSKEARLILDKLNVESSLVDRIYESIAKISFKGTGLEHPKTVEGLIVQDADRLDGLGAIGIARTFAYGGYKGREMYNPDIKPAINQTKVMYMQSASPTINHFYEKLLLLKDLMNTAEGKRLAQSRHEYMEQFLQQFFAEWDGKL